MESAIAALSGADATCATPNVATASDDAVRHRERRDRLHERPPVAHDEQQPQDEEQMVQPEQNVLNAEIEIGP